MTIKELIEKHKLTAVGEYNHDISSELRHFAVELLELVRSWTPPAPDRYWLSEQCSLDKALEELKK